jgi:fermentation-respiration switch protein FrsA (DUF1100 family)
MKTSASVIFIIFSGFFCTSCSSVFYYPDHVQYVDVDKLPIHPELLHIPAKDGHPIPAWYFKTNQKKRLGLIVQFHGNAQNMTSHFMFLSSAPFRGYDHLIFDYRGYGGSEGRPTPKNTVSDGMDVLRWCKEHFPKSRLIVFGQSLGGAVAMKALINLKGELKPDAVVIDSSFLSYRSEARTLLAEHWLTWLLQPIGWLVVDNSQGPGKEISTLAPLPFLVVHGDDDHVVSFSHGEKVFRAAPEPKTFWRVSGGRHTDFMLRKEFVDRFYAYLNQLFSF